MYRLTPPLPPQKTKINISQQQQQQQNLFFIYLGPSRLLHHIRYRHVPNKSYQCPLCHKSYKTVQSLSLHIETHGEYSVICKWPGCSFLAKSERLLRIHEHSIHQNVGNAKLFCCHVCSSRFLLGRQLTSHLKKIHGFELPPGHCRFR